MTIALHRFCVNRKIAPGLDIPAFFKMVNRLGLNKVELRNDMPGGKVTDDLSAAQVRDWRRVTTSTLSLLTPSTRLTSARPRCAS